MNKLVVLNYPLTIFGFELPHLFLLIARGTMDLLARVYLCFVTKRPWCHYFVVDFSLVNTHKSCSSLYIIEVSLQPPL